MIADADLDLAGKLVARLGTDADGEVIATVQALRRVLASGGADFNDLANLVASASPRAVSSFAAGGIDWPAFVGELIAKGAGRNAKERAFLEGVYSWVRTGREPSPKQRDWLRGIAEAAS